MNRQFDRRMDHVAGRDPGIVWRVLAVLNLYRVLVPLVLLALYFLGGVHGFAVYSRQLFFGAAVFYFAFGLVSVLLYANAWRVRGCKLSCKRQSICLY